MLTVKCKMFLLNNTPQGLSTTAFSYPSQFLTAGILPKNLLIPCLCLLISPQKRK